ncbi:putative CSC1/OSCA1-like 7TM region domain-containing protein [Seiridium unicorne]|uniref:CSC1/OSCA1-like 7TM region domain-containing protein n=1 Tax=Seiridium unicorne TaxID=138068 RepID=A0ABR2V703_9PEZI
MSTSLNTTDPNAGTAEKSQGISLVAFVTSLAAALISFGIQTGLFLILRQKLARIFKPKTYLVPERERTDPPPESPWGLVNALMRVRDREIIKKCGLDSYFFLRYLQTLLIIFIPMAVIIIPILIPINYVGGIGQDVTVNASDVTDSSKNVTGLDTLAWGNIRPTKTHRYWAHLILAVCVILWVCGVFFAEMRVFIKIRQDWLTTAEHRLRASATTVLVSSIPDKWLSEEALRGLFDVFPGGIRNIFMTRDLTPLLDKIKKRDKIHKQLEGAETELIRECKKNQLKQREAEEKQARKESKTKAPTKVEKAERQQAEDAAAKAQAESGAGASSGDHHEVPHDVHEGLQEAQVVEEQSGEHRKSSEHLGRPSRDEGGLMNIPILGAGLSKLTEGLGRGAGAVGKTGQGILGGARNVAGQLDNQIETTNGFVTIAPSRPDTRTSDRRHVRLPDEEDMARPSTSGSDRRRVMGHVPTNSTAGARLTHSRDVSVASQGTAPNKESIEMKQFGNTTRKVSNIDDMYINERARWFQFWKPPSGGFASPIPQGAESSEFPFDDKTAWQKFKSAIPFLGDKEEDKTEYPKAYNEDYDEQGETKAEWEKWLKEKDRPTHRLARFEWTPDFLPGLPYLNEKVDTIYWCRKELARFNLEIEEDQKHPERFPLMTSAFIQFNHQVAAHMACQSVIHHIPRHMAPRTVEISPNDVIWDNMTISWWAEWLRTGIVIAVVAGMIILWAIPVSFTSTISQIDSLIQTYPWLGFLAENDTVHKAVQALAGVLPAVLLALLLFLVPIIMDLLADFKGAKTGSQKTETVQTFYFAFLLVQVFFVVSLASSVTNILGDLAKDPGSIADVLANSLPKAANYFFSYMILQALSTSSGTLLQIGALINWYVIAKITNSTARNKWTTNTNLPSVRWGSFFPVYTNFACIGLIYSVIAPLISIFAIITFSLLWVANRYTMLYVNRLSVDTGGVLYPRAINQTFAGLYIMEICLIGLFFIAQDEFGNLACTPQAIIMIVVTVFTVLYQFLLNYSFGPLFRYLPITFEDEAVLRDEAFQRAQDRRLGLIEDEDEDDVIDKEGLPPHHHRGSLPTNSMDGAAEKHRRGNKFTNFAPVKGLAHAGTWAIKGGKALKDQTYGRAEQGVKTASKYREERRKKDLEAQRAIGEALYGGYHDEIEDLTPEERDALVQHAFKHQALRARRPTIWIPRDDLGVSDDEISRTQQYSEHIWISNEGTALDSKVRVVYGRAPPDFSELDLINL